MRYRVFITLSIVTLFLSDCKTTLERQESDTRPSEKQEQSVPADYLAEKKYLNDMFTAFRTVLPNVRLKIDHGMSWKELENELEKISKTSPKQNANAKKALQLIRFFRQSPQRIGKIYRLPFKWIGENSQPEGFQLYKNRILLHPETWSLWKQCKTNFERISKGWKANLISGYKSPAYQMILLSTSKYKTLGSAIMNTAPPFYSRHQKPVNDVSVTLSSIARLKTKKPWKLFRNLCRQYHFVPSFPDKYPGEYSTVRLKPLYLKLNSKKYMPSKLIENIYAALERNKTYLPDYYFSVLVAMSYQEAGLSWNPKVGSHKKNAFREQIEPFFKKTEKGITGVLAKWILDPSLEKEKAELHKELLRLTRLNNLDIREYDIYQWSRKTWGLYKKIAKKNNAVNRLSQIVGSVKKRINKLQYEPQTFGLWQLNVNQLIERLGDRKVYWNRFPNIITRNRPDRHLIIKAMSGFENVQDKVTTLDLQLKISILPRYINHNLGDKKDIQYFIAENLTGEMSTFRAAIQKQLNREVGTNLVLDGDLAHYKTYSTKIDWGKVSNTQKALRQYINFKMNKRDKSQYKKLIAGIIEADSTRKLLKSRLYRHLMKERHGERIFPTVRSKLYKQSATEYVKRILSITEYIRR